MAEAASALGTAMHSALRTLAGAGDDDGKPKWRQFKCKSCSVQPTGKSFNKEMNVTQDETALVPLNGKDGDFILLETNDGLGRNSSGVKWTGESEKA